LMSDDENIGWVDLPSFPFAGGLGSAASVGHYPTRDRVTLKHHPVFMRLTAHGCRTEAAL
jgi:hypothetical protein